MPLLKFNLTGKSTDQYVNALRDAYSAFGEIFNPSVALDKEPDLWNKIRADAVFQVAINQELHSIARPDWRIRPATQSEVDRMAAAVVQDAFMQISNMKDALLGLAEAVFKGLAFRGIVGERRLTSLGGGTPLDWWVPTRLQDFGPLRVMHKAKKVQRPDGTNELFVIPYAYDIANDRWVEWTNPEWFVRSCYDDSEEWLSFGRGIVEAVYFYWWLKGQALVHGLNFIKRLSEGYIDVAVDSEAPGSEDRTSDEALKKLIDSIDEGRERGIIGHDKRDDIKVVEASGTGWQAFFDFIRYIDDAVTRCFSGSLRSSGGGSGSTGARSQSETEADTSEGQSQFRREKISDDMTRDAIGLWWRLNSAQLRAAGLGAAKMPFFDMAQEKKADPAVRAPVIKTAHDAGIDLDAADVYRQLGLEQPRPGAPVIKGATAAAPGAGPFGT